MKFLYVINSSEFFCSHFIHLAKSVSDAGHSVVIACGDDEFREVIESNGLMFRLISLDRKSKAIFKEIKSLKSIMTIIKEESPDVAHMLTIKPIVYAGFIFKLPIVAKPKVLVFSITGLGSLSLSTSLLSRSLWAFIGYMYKFVLRNKNAKVIFENSDDMDLFVRRKLVQQNQAFLVSGAGVDTNKFYPSEKKENKFTVVLVARLLKDKGICEFIEAGKLLKQQGLDISLKLVGTVDEKNISSMSNDEVDLANSNGYINYVGFCTDINKIYQSAHVACLPSYREGLPKSLIEAAACGLPILTTDVPGCRQMISHQKQNGVLVPPRDAHALADAIKGLYEHSDLLISMGMNSREMALDKFDYRQVLKVFFSIYGLSDSKSNQTDLI